MSSLLGSYVAALRGVVAEPVLLLKGAHDLVGLGPVVPVDRQGDVPGRGKMVTVQGLLQHPHRVAVLLADVQCGQQDRRRTVSMRVQMTDAGIASPLRSAAQPT